MQLRAHQALHRVPGLLEHAAHNVLAAFVQFDADEGIALVLVHDLREVRLGHAVLQLDALLELAHELVIALTQHRGQVGLAHLVLWVHEAVSQLAVVGEQQQTLSIGIQATHVEQALAGHNPVRHHVTNARAAHVIRHRGLHAPRLVQHEVLRVLVDVDANTVDADDVGVGIDAGALGDDDLAIDFDAAFINQNLRVAAGSHAGLSQDLLEALALCGLAAILLRLGVVLNQPISPQIAGNGVCGGGTLLLYMLVARRLSVGNQLIAGPLLLFRCAIAASGWSHGFVSSR